MMLVEINTSKYALLLFQHILQQMTLVSGRVVNILPSFPANPVKKYLLEKTTLTRSNIVLKKYCFLEKLWFPRQYFFSDYLLHRQFYFRASTFSRTPCKLAHATLTRTGLENVHQTMGEGEAGNAYVFIVFGSYDGEGETDKGGEYDGDKALA